MSFQVGDQVLWTDNKDFGVGHVLGTRGSRVDVRFDGYKEYNDSGEYVKNYGQWDYHRVLSTKLTPVRTNIHPGDYVRSDAFPSYGWGIVLSVTVDGLMTYVQFVKGDGTTDTVPTMTSDLRKVSLPPLNLSPVHPQHTAEPKKGKVSYYTFPDGTEVRQISAHLASFPAQIVQYAARSGRMDGNCKSEDLADRIRDFKKVRDFATWEIERLEAL